MAAIMLISAPSEIVLHQAWKKKRNSISRVRLKTPEVTPFAFNTQTRGVPRAHPVHRARGDRLSNRAGLE